MLKLWSYQGPTLGYRKEDFEFAEGMVDIDQVLHEYKPPPLNNSSTTAKRDNYAI